jgi:hypothetical protein
MHLSVLPHTPATPPPERHKAPIVQGGRWSKFSVPSWSYATLYCTSGWRNWIPKWVIFQLTWSFFLLRFKFNFSVFPSICFFFNYSRFLSIWTSYSTLLTQWFVVHINACQLFLPVQKELYLLVPVQDSPVILFIIWLIFKPFTHIIFHSHA